MRILALALTLFVGVSPAVWAATFTVTDTGDTLNAGSLRAAIIAANGNGEADVINLLAGTYLLAIAGRDEEAAAEGDLDITDDLTISGAGAATTIIDANEIDRVFHVIDANVTFSDVTISNGMVIGAGGGIRNDGGMVTLTHSIVSGNTAAEDGVNDGGGIANIGGTLELRNSTVSDNTATDAGGGIFNRNSFDGTRVGSVLLINSTVSDNTAREDGGGIRNMQATTAGASATVELINSTVRGNTTNDDGGGIRNNRGTVTLINSTVSGNTAADDPDLVDNFGGGIFNNNGGTLTLTNSTVSGNTAADQGGGMRNDTGSTVTLFNSTITDNKAGPGGGGGIRNRGTVTFQNTIIAGNKADMDTERDCRGTLTSLGDNLVGAGTGCPSSAMMGDQTVDVADVFTMVLGPLQDNGGPTSTHALLAGSPAIDAGNPAPAGCTDDTGATLTTDQRGVHRPLGLCDIGAYEEFSQHYTGYDVDPEAVIGGGGKKSNELNINVTLQDQFFGPSLLTVRKAKRLLMPVDKNEEGLSDEVSHLLCYDLRDALGGKGTGVEPGVNVAVVNQFNDMVGAQIMEVKKLKRLCVPSTKERLDIVEEPPALADVSVEHFTSYEVRSEAVIGGGGKKGNELNINVMLTDQFGTSDQTVRKAKRLLVPVSKNGEGIADKVNHLVCYELRDALGGKGTGVEPGVNVAVVNQFNDLDISPRLPIGAQIMEVKKLKVLCVPSTKVLQ